MRPAHCEAGTTSGSAGAQESNVARLALDMINRLSSRSYGVLQL